MKKLFAISAAILAPLALALPSHAQIITWGAAQNMTGDSDVLDVGTLIDAVTLATSPVSFDGGTLTFNSIYNTTHTHTDGIITITNSDNTGAFGAAFSKTSPSSTSYSSLVTSGTFGESGTANSADLVTLGGLTMGDSYQVEAWAYYTGDGVTSATTFTGATPVSLLVKTGQYSVGTFIATGPTETFNYVTNNGHNFINAVSVFDTTVAPEPSTHVMFGLGFLGLVLLRKRFARV